MRVLIACQVAAAARGVCQNAAALALGHPAEAAAAVHVPQAALGQAADPAAAALGPEAVAEEEGGPCGMGREGLGAAALDLAAVAAAAGPAGSQRPG